MSRLLGVIAQSAPAAPPYIAPRATRDAAAMYCRGDSGPLCGTTDSPACAMHTTDYTPSRNARLWLALLFALGLAALRPDAPAPATKAAVAAVAEPNLSAAAGTQTEVAHARR